MSKKDQKAREWRLYLSKLDKINPQKAARLVYAHWFRVAPLALSARDSNWLVSAQPRSWQTSIAELPGYEWPAPGPVVVLLHGWGGRGSQMAFLAQQLYQRGFYSVVFDAPAHGDAPGHHSNVLSMARAFTEVLEQMRPVEAVVTHSYGLVAALLAHKENSAQFKKLVAISPSSRVEARLEDYVNALGIGAATHQAFLGLIAGHLDSSWWQRISPLNNVVNSGLEGLIIHDQEDKIVPVEEARVLHQVWRNSTLVETKALGHLRILSAPGVAQTILDFL